MDDHLEPQGKSPGRIDALVELAWEQVWRDAARAVELASQALADSTEGAGDPRALAVLAFAEVRRSRYAEAAAVAERALTTLPKDSLWRARTHNALAQVHYYQGRFEQAHESLERTREVLSSLASAPAEDEARLHNEIGRLYYDRGDLASAYRAFRAARDAASSDPATARRQAAYADMNVGNVMSDLGDFSRAMECFRSSLAAQRESGDPTGARLSLYNLAELHWRMGDVPGGVRFAREALATGEPSDYWLQACRTLLSNLLCLVNRHDEARDLADQALAWNRASAGPPGVSRALRARGRVLLAAGRTAEAVRDFTEAMELAQQSGDEQINAQVAMRLAEAELARGDAAAALAALAHTRPMLEAGHELAGRVEELLGQALEAQGDRAQAAEHYRRVLEHERKTEKTASRQRIEVLRVIHEVEQARRGEQAMRVARDELDQRVRERTAELTAANQRLSREIAERQRSEAERSRLETQLRQRQRMEAMGHLAGGVAHDFNNLLTIISGYSEVLLAQFEPSDSKSQMVTEIRDAGERAAALTRQLLAFSRRTLLEPRVLDLNRLVRENQQILSRLIGEDVELTAVLDPELMPVKVDPGQIGQVIMNLSINARDAMPRGGKLTIETGNVVLDQAFVAEHPEAEPGNYALLAVTDNGSGMTPEVQAHVFEPFFTTKGSDRGTGLGLATVYGIVKQSGGFIYVHSTAGRGTSFKLYFPWADAAVSDREPAQASSIAARGTETILLVEDEDAVRSIVRLVLQQFGYTVLTARRGMEAIGICRTHPGPIDLLLTDVVMPQMSGRELLEQLVPVRPGLKVIYLSGYPDDALVRHGVLQSDVAFLQKPFSMTSLTGKVRSVLDDQA